MVPAMSERSTYLRDQAYKCEWHASQMTSRETVPELRELASHYIIEAAEIERTEMPPANWTDDDERHLMELKAAQITSRVMAKELGRSISAVEQRLYILRDRARSESK